MSVRKKCYWNPATPIHSISSVAAWPQQPSPVNQLPQKPYGQKAKIFAICPLPEKVCQLLD